MSVAWLLTHANADTNSHTYERTSFNQSAQITQNATDSSRGNLSIAFMNIQLANLRAAIQIKHQAITYHKLLERATAANTLSSDNVKSTSSIPTTVHQNTQNHFWNIHDECCDSSHHFHLKNEYARYMRYSHQNTLSHAIFTINDANNNKSHLKKYAQSSQYVRAAFFSFHSK